ncbi:hypothetical protein JTB14_010542 [Gonioctena quinquepunctata]|nr:hypothetical protein JTB14_010542 [Gonioctena quinquepunctata]
MSRYRFKYIIPEYKKLPTEIRNEVSSYLEEKQPGKKKIKIDYTDGELLSDNMRETLEGEITRIETIEDFAGKVGEDYESIEYRYIIPNLKYNTQQKMLWLEYGYRMEKILSILDMIERTLERNEYQPLEKHPDMYRDEYS